MRPDPGGDAGPVVGYVSNGPYVVRGGGATLKNVEQGKGASAKRFALCRPEHEQAVL